MRATHAIEKLARDICWAGFITPEGRRGHTRAGYWNSLPKETRDDYTREAERLVWVLFRPGIMDAINAVRQERGEICFVHGPEQYRRAVKLAEDKPTPEVERG